MEMTVLFAKRLQQIAAGSKVLICCLDPCFREALDDDFNIYSSHYRSVDAVILSDIKELMGALDKGYDIVHLLCPVAAGGLIEDSSGATLLGSDLITMCCERDVKLLWIANDNKPDDYVRGFRAQGKRLNLIMTISRRGKKFANFLEELLSRISKGEKLPVAWVSLVPQAEGPWQQDLPGCIFFAGRPDEKLPS